MYNCNFTMRDKATGISITQNLGFDLPDWVRSRSQFMLGEFARMNAEEHARQFFGTDDVTVTMHVVNGVEYAY